MPNVAALLKAEMARVARRESKVEMAALKKAVSTQRSEIAALKRRLQEMERAMARLHKGALTSVKAGERSEGAAPEDASGFRFSAKGLRSQRARLALSAADVALLIGTTSQSIFNWEDGKARPLKRFLPALAALRTLGKKSAAAHLAEIKARR